MRRLVAGDQSALLGLYDAYAGLVNALARRILRDAAEAEDVVQEVFVQVWRQADRFDPARGNLRAWLWTIARTRAHDRRRRRSARREDAAPRFFAALSIPPRDQALVVTQALDRLNTDQRCALELAYFEGLTHPEISDRLGEPLGTIKTRIRLAMIQLRRLLGAPPHGGLK